MGIFAKSIERRSDGQTTLLSNPAQWLFEAFGAVPTDSGIAVSERNALKYTAVYSCVNVLAQTIGQVPWDVYRQTGKTKVVAHDRTEHYLLHNEPNAAMTSYSFRVAAMACALLWGNAYIEIVRDGANRVRFFRLLEPWTVTVYEALDQERLVYNVTRRDGTTDSLDCSDVIHIPCMSLDGIAGLSPIAQHRQAIGLGLAAENAGAAFFGNGSRPSGYLSTDKPMRKDDREDTEKKWLQKFSGSRKTGAVPVLSGGLKWTQLSIPPADAQYIETRNFQAGEIARVYRVPAVLIGLADKTSTYASAEAFFLSFVKFTIAPWAQAIDQEFNRKLFPNTDLLYCKLDLNGLMRGDPKARGEFYKTLWSMGSFSANMILDWEDMDPIEGGDRHFVQQGFMPLDKVDEIIAKQGSQPANPDKTPGNPAADEKKASRSVHTRWLQDVAGRVGKWEKRDAEKVAAAFVPVFESLDPSGGVSAYCSQLAAEFDPTDINFAQRSIERFEECCQ